MNLYTTSTWDLTTRNKNIMLILRCRGMLPFYIDIGDFALYHAPTFIRDRSQQVINKCLGPYEIL